MKLMLAKCPGHFLLKLTVKIYIQLRSSNIKTHLIKHQMAKNWIIRALGHSSNLPTYMVYTTFSGKLKGNKLQILSNKVLDRNEVILIFLCFLRLD